LSLVHFAVNDLSGGFVGSDGQIINGVVAQVVAELVLDDDELDPLLKVKDIELACLLVLLDLVILLVVLAQLGFVYVLNAKAISVNIVPTVISVVVVTIVTVVTCNVQE